MKFLVNKTWGFQPGQGEGDPFDSLEEDQSDGEDTGIVLLGISVYMDSDSSSSNYSISAPPYEPLSDDDM